MHHTAELGVRSVEGLIDRFLSVDVCKSDAAQMQDKIDLLSKVSPLLACNCRTCRIHLSVVLTAYHPCAWQAYHSLPHSCPSADLRCALDGGFSGPTGSSPRVSLRHFIAD